MCSQKLSKLAGSKFDAAYIRGYVMRSLCRLHAILGRFAKSVPYLSRIGEYPVKYIGYRRYSSMDYTTWSHEELVKRVTKLESELRAQNEQ